MSQKIKKISLYDLVLWTENPRDLIRVESNQEIADRAISDDGRSRWSIRNLCKSMQSQVQKQYYLNELPTVCYHGNRPIVYDGNRHVLIGMLMHKLVTIPDLKWGDLGGFEFPSELECNVCDKDTALGIVDRMHADNGTWEPLERDIFKNQHMKKGKSAFLLLNEATEIISTHPHLNKRFVRDEILTSDNLRKLGFDIDTNKGSLKHHYNTDEEAIKVLTEVSRIIKDKEVTTRKNRGEIVKAVWENKDLKHPAKSRKTRLLKKKVAKLTPRKSPKKHKLFGEDLTLPAGEVNNIYRDICSFYKHVKNKDSYSYPMMFVRVGMRILCETVAKNNAGKRGLVGKVTINPWIEKYFGDAKQQLSTDEKNMLKVQAVSSTVKLKKLLRSGAHSYTSSENEDQTIAMSLILGKMLTLWADDSAKK